MALLVLRLHGPEVRQVWAAEDINDDTLSPGATWPLHPHRHNEVVTYVAGGEFRHEDERGLGGVLKQGGVQHTTVGRGMWHAEMNNRPDIPMRFIQLWFLPERLDLDPSVEQKAVSRSERTNGFLPLASSRHEGALPLRSDASVFSSFLETAGPSLISWNGAGERTSTCSRAARSGPTASRCPRSPPPSSPTRPPSGSRPTTTPSCC